MLINDPLQEHQVLIYMLQHVEEHHHIESFVRLLFLIADGIRRLPCERLDICLGVMNIPADNARSLCKLEHQLLRQKSIATAHVQHAAGADDFSPFLDDARKKM